MATIKNTISMQDKMTPVLRSIIKSMQSTLDVMARVDKVSDKAFDQMKMDINAAADALDNFNRGVDEIPPAGKKAEESFTRWKNPLVTAAGAIYTLKSAIQGISKITDISDQFILTSSRLDLMNDGLQTTAKLQDIILASAQRSRTAYGSTADAVAKLGILAKDAFSGTEEIVAFTELMNKSFKVGGAGVQEQTSAMYQLTQAMAAGKLQGDEFRSIMENAPMLADAIAKFAGKSKGELKEMSSEGLITADMIKGALFSAADDINAKFATMPRTFGDVWTSVKNLTLRAFQPIIERIGTIVNNPGFETFTNNFANGLVWVADKALDLVDIISNISDWVKINWSVIEPILKGVVAGILLVIGYILLMKAITIAMAAPMAIAWMQANWPLLLLMGTLIALIALWDEVGTAGRILIGIIGAIVAIIVIWIAVQQILNVALTANPIGLIIMAIGLLIIIIAAVILWIIKMWKTNMDFKYGIIGIWNDILNFFDQVPIFFQWVGNGIADAFGWASGQVMSIVEGMTNFVINSINYLINQLNKIPGVAIKALDKVEVAASFKIEEEARKQARADNLQANKDTAAQKAADRARNMELSRARDEAMLAKQAAAAEAEKNAQQDLGANGLDKYLANTPGEFDWEKYMNDAAMAGNPTINGGKLDSVGKIKDDVSITDEDIKLLKDVAATEFVNRYTTLRPEMTVSFGDVRETADVNKIMDALEVMMEDALATSLVG